MTIGWKPEQRTVGNRNDASALHELMEEAQLSPAELLAREVIQNSRDASMSPLLESDPEHHFRMEFEFRTLKGAELENIKSALGLRVLAGHLKLSQDQAGGLRSLSTPIYLSDAAEVPILVMSDFGATGLGGQLEQLDDSAYYRALMTLGVKRKENALSGGSKGFGKAAFVKGSAVGTVFAFSKFLSGPDMKPQFHFGGVCYGDGYQQTLRGNSVKFTGMATFGDESRSVEGLLNPVEGTPARNLADALGLPSREGDSLNSLGTTLVLLFPQTSASDLVSAIENHWWPAIALNSLDIVVKEGDKEIRPNPARDRRLSNYMEAYRVAMQMREKSEFESVDDLRPMDDASLAELLQKRYRVPLKQGLARVGRLVLKYDPELAYATEEQQRDPDFQFESKIALVRSTGMVIDLYPVRHRNDPLLQGVFVANSDVEPLLRELEPAAHNYWWPSSRERKLSQKQKLPIPTLLTDAIEDRLKAKVREFRRSLKVPANVETRRLTFLSKALGDIFRTRGGGGAVVEGEFQPIEIHDQSCSPLPGEKPSTTRFRVSFKVRLSNRFSEASSLAVVSINPRRLESESDLGDALAYEWDVIAKGFRPAQNPQDLQGTLIRGEWAHFAATTEAVRTASIVPEIRVGVPARPRLTGQAQEAEGYGQANDD